jgi:hypothetical protein
MKQLQLGTRAEAASVGELLQLKGIIVSVVSCFRLFFYMQSFLFYIVLHCFLFFLFFWLIAEK